MGLFRNSGAAGGGSGTFSKQFNTVNLQLVYTSANIGVDMTGRTMFLMTINGLDWFQQGDASIVGSGITLTNNPGAGVALVQYS